MGRQNVYDDDLELGPRVVGWFDPAKAEQCPEGTRWDGRSSISLATGAQHEHEMLWRTSGGRWVLNAWSAWQGTAERWVYVGDEEARAWLIANDYEAEEIERLTGEDVPDEAPVMGRPEVGPQLKMRVAAETLAAIDERADAAGMTRSAWVRQALERAVSD